MIARTHVVAVLLLAACASSQQPERAASVSAQCPGGAIDFSSDPRNCGECKNVCTFDQAVAACVEGHCRLAACAPGWGDCDKDPGTGCEADLATNPSHCSACGVSCGGAGCRGGKCLPGPRTVTGARGLWDITADAAHVYWTSAEGSENTSIWSAPVDEGPPKQIAANRKAISLIAVGAGTLYWAEDRSHLFAMAAAGGPVREVWKGGDIRTLEADEQGAVWAAEVETTPYTRANILFSASPAGDVRRLRDMSTSAVCDIALDGPDVYARTVSYHSAGLMAIRREGGASRQMSVQLKYDGCLGPSLAVSGGTVYWSDVKEEHGVWQYSLLGMSASGEGPPRVLAMTKASALNLTVQGGRVVWTEERKVEQFRQVVDIWQLAPGSAPERIASDQDGLQRFTGAAGRLFWTLMPLSRLEKLEDGGTGWTALPSEVRELRP